jgi:hypothetical protein
VPDVKGKMNGFAALDIRYRRRYPVVKPASDKPLPPVYILLCSVP